MRHHKLWPILPLFLLILNVGWAFWAVAEETIDLPIIAQWSGDFPVVGLEQLLNQRQNRVGYIDDPKQFAAVWQFFRPNESTPEVDFTENLIVFSRNIEFYNPTKIFKVSLTDGLLEVFAMETMSAIPIDNKVAMALALIPRAGVEALKITSDKSIGLD